MRLCSAKETHKKSTWHVKVRWEGEGWQIYWRMDVKTAAGYLPNNTMFQKILMVKYLLFCTQWQIWQSIKRFNLLFYYCTSYHCRWRVLYSHHVIYDSCIFRLNIVYTAILKKHIHFQPYCQTQMSLLDNSVKILDYIQCVFYNDCVAQ